MTSCWVIVEPPRHRRRATQVVLDRLAQLLQVEAVVLVEAIVLGGDDGARKIGTERPQRDEPAARPRPIAVLDPALELDERSPAGGKKRR